MAGQGCRTKDAAHSLVACLARQPAVMVSSMTIDVLVIGGNGRVGASTVRWLHQLSLRRNASAPLRLAIGGRSRAHFEAVQNRLALPKLVFRSVDLETGFDSLVAVVRGVKLVVHTAGPFQGCTQPDLLRACIAAGVPYCDVCDEFALSRHAKELSSEAAAAGIPAVVSCGIWPGVSALMAIEAAQQLGGPESCERIELSFFTAGTGGAGPTIVSATFLLLATKVLTYLDGSLTLKEPWTERRVVDFGSGVGRHACFLLDNPDVPTTVEALAVANCASRFGTAPGVWNSLFAAMKLLPSDWLFNRSAMQGLALFSMPFIRVVDKLVGATNAIRVDAFRKGDASSGMPAQVTLRCVHADLEDCVGQATAAFALELLRGRSGLSSAEQTIPSGVWYPAELQAKARSNILNVASEKALIWEI
ncbi:MAG: hypothetical protein CMN92_04965 [Synechococcus sp. CPC100]|nr:hypothetical protein [Synechococcus sp. CPC100]